MYISDLVYRPERDISSSKVLPYRPEDKRTMEIDLLEQDRRDIPAIAEEFLEAYLRGGDQMMAGYIPYAGSDPGGPESPEAEAAFAEYLRQRRERGDFQRARQRLIERGFPLPGV